MRTSALFGAKNLDSSKFMVCPNRQGEKGVKQVRIFFGQGMRGSNFQALLQTSSMDGSLDV